MQYAPICTEVLKCQSTNVSCYCNELNSSYHSLIHLIDVHSSVIAVRYRLSGNLLNYEPKLLYFSTLDIIT